MTLEKYLELIYAVYETFYLKIDDYYKQANFVSNITGNVPIKYIIKDGELKVLVRKTAYSNYEQNTHVHITTGLFKPLLSNNYMVEGMVVYPINNSAVKEALEYVEEHKDLFKNFQERKSFYSGNYRVTMESYDFSKEKENNTLEITINYGDYESAHLYVDFDKRYLETVDTFSNNHLKEIIIPEEIIPDTIKELAMANNLPISQLTEEELTIHKWYPQPIDNIQERSKRRWLIF